MTSLPVKCKQNHVTTHSRLGFTAHNCHICFIWRPFL